MSSRRARCERGLSLIELVVFIVVLAIGVTGVAILFNQMTRSSVDPVVRKQALAIATSLMEEVELHAFTYCDPDDPAVTTATSVGFQPNAPCSPLASSTWSATLKAM